MAERQEVSGITIDAASTRDIDDAIWVSQVPEGFRVFVTISDASHLVPLASELDERAKNAATTRYFAAGNSPMLPRSLSENSLSLLPEQPRDTLTVEALVSPGCLETSLKGVYLSRLTSKARVAYSDIPSFIKATPGTFNENSLDGQIRLAARLGMGLLDQRRKAGALALYDLNTGWVTTEEGYLRQLEKKEDTIGNIIVQEMMVLANRLVAEFAVKNDIPALFRNHQARAAAPDRSELMGIIQGALQGPVQNLDLIRQQTHLLLEKAAYGASLLGHYGLNLPAYLHFTSPIRRYADLATHRQIKAFLLGEPFPHTKEEMEVLALHINEVLQEEKEATSQHLKAKAENKAQATLDPRRLEGLNAKDFERVIKVWSRSENEVPDEIESAYLHRLRDNRIPLVCFPSVLFEAKPELGWAKIQEASLAHLKNRLEDAVSVFTMAVQIHGWEAPTYQTQREGPDHAPTFKAQIHFAGHALRSLEGAALRVDEVEAGSLKEAKQKAVLGLISALVGYPQPTWGQIQKSETNVKGEPSIDWSKEPIAVLQEYSQAIGQPAPSYDFKVSGPSHLPIIACTCSFGSFTKTANAGKKQDAKRLAAFAILKTMGKR